MRSNRYPLPGTEVFRGVGRGVGPIGVGVGSEGSVPGRG